jgi:hypothetical protein
MTLGGLAIAVVGQLHGTISANSPGEGSGSTFWSSDNWWQWPGTRLESDFEISANGKILSV